MEEKFLAFLVPLNHRSVFRVGCTCNLKRNTFPANMGVSTYVGSSYFIQHGSSALGWWREAVEKNERLPASSISRGEKINSGAREASMSWRPRHKKQKILNDKIIIYIEVYSCTSAIVLLCVNSVAILLHRRTWTH